MAWLIGFLQIILMAVVMIVVYNILKKVVLSKIKINKWIVLALGIGIFIVQVIVTAKIQNFYLELAFQALFILVFLWFLDLCGFTSKAYSNQNQNNINRAAYKKKDKKNDIIRPKAKPNRVKNINKK